jgi:hypothetical protein
MLREATFQQRQLDYLPRIACLAIRIDFPSSKIVLVYLLQFACSGKHLRFKARLPCDEWCKG